MVRSDPHDSPPSGETLYQVIAQCATAARPRVLAAVAVLSGAASVALLRVSAHYWPLAMLFFATVAVCLWGLIEQGALRSRFRATMALELLLVIVGSAAALLGVLGVFLWILGPAPVL
jgi:cation transport ATPase